MEDIGGIGIGHTSVRATGLGLRVHQGDGLVLVTLGDATVLKCD